MFKRSMFWLIFLLPLILVPAGMVQGDAPDDSGWLMSAGNADRSGFVDVELPSKLAPRWVYAARVAPKPAWPRLDKMPFDRAFHPVAAEGKVFFASSGDGGVYALDVATGKQQWSFFTEGPVRFAPAIWQDRMFVGSDDGYLYCLRLADGELLWKKRGGPSDQMVLGNERMISRWPVRGGPVVRSDIVYFAAGIFPTDGVFLYALDAKTGEDVWVNRDSGNIYMAQPHGGAFAESGVSAQGYLVATEEKLVVPTGRGVPAVFDRATGKFKYYYLQKAGWRGGATTMIAGSICYNNGHVIDLATGKILTNIGGGALARSNEGLVHATGKGTIFCKWVEAQNVNDKGETITTRKLDAYKHNKDVKLTTSAIVAGNTVVIGGKDSVVGMSLQSGETLWQLHVDGEAYALAAADGKLLIGTDAGEIYCFGEMDSSSVARDDAPSEQVESIAIADATQRAAEAIVAKSGIVEGYAIDLGAGEGDLAIALAQESMLHIIAVEPDPRKAAMARQRAISA
ncbi:MAG: PQQ-binding-like beta-propeller repeat protein, partial [Rhodospirillales bacterium]|nr:PQQ-binding-like beta-propeller repeat protein [Rhodospirillales bacterium]